MSDQATHDETANADDSGEGARSSRLYLMVIAPAAVVILIILVLIARSLDPAPPKSIRMATGSAGGAYAAAGEAIRARLAEDGITVELVATSGSVENLGLLLNADTDAGLGADMRVDVAIIQGGVGLDHSDDEALAALAALFYEPMFVFTHVSAPVSDLRDLRGRTVAVGPEGSGMRALLSVMLEENGLTAADVTLSPLTGQAAADALSRGAIDAAVFVTSPSRPYLRDLLLDPRVRIVNFDRAEAYARRHRYLSPVLLPRGVVDLGQDAPRADVDLIAPAAALVVRADLHPAIQTLLLQSVSETYRAGDVIAPPDRFPTRDLLSFTLAKEAKRYFDRGGPSFLRRYLPFWAANLVDRLWVLAIPAATLLYPLFKVAPPAYRWQVQRRIIRWYRDLRRLESEGRAATNTDDRTRVRDALTTLLADVGALKVPLSYNDDVYRLRAHIRLVEQLVAEAPMAAGATGATSATGESAAG